MKKIMIISTLVLLAACTGQKENTETVKSTEQAVRAEQTISRQGTVPTTQGDAANFTGVVTVEGIYQPVAPSHTYAAYVTFEPGARTNWHSHPLGQTLIVTEGIAWTQDEFGNTHEAYIGDVIHCPSDVTHWHGASPYTRMTHVSVSERLDGAGVTWLEPVTDEQYKEAGSIIGGS